MLAPEHYSNGSVCQWLQKCLSTLIPLHSVMMLPWWLPSAIPLLFGSLSEEAVMRRFGNRIFLGFFLHTIEAQHGFSYRKYRNHLKLMKSNLHWLGQRWWMLFIVHQTTQKYSLFCFQFQEMISLGAVRLLNSVWKVRCARLWVFVFLPSWGWCEMCCNGVSWAFIKWQALC